MAKKAPAKPAAKRKPRAKKPVQPAIELSEKDVLKSSSPWRRFMLVGIAVAGLAVSFAGGVWSAGGWQIGPGPKNDAVSAVFDTQESAFRLTIGEQVGKLRAGEFATEKQAEKWFTDTFGPKAEAAWNSLLEKHFEAYGGKNWTAEKQAATIEGYAR